MHFCNFKVVSSDGKEMEVRVRSTETITVRDARTLAEKSGFAAADDALIVEVNEDLHAGRVGNKPANGVKLRFFDANEEEGCNRCSKAQLREAYENFLDELITVVNKIKKINKK